MHLTIIQNLPITLEGKSRGTKINILEVIAVVGTHMYDVIQHDKSTTAPSVSHTLDCIQRKEG